MCALNPKAISNRAAAPCRLTTMTHRLREAEHEYLVPIEATTVQDP